MITVQFILLCSSLFVSSLKFHRRTNLFSSRDLVIEAPYFGGGIRKDGFYNSFDVYTCNPATQSLIASEIENWSQVERLAILDDASTHSVVLTSLDGKRVLHNIGWKLGKQDLQKVFKRFEERSDGKDGTPAALKESAHVYDIVYSTPSHSSIQFTPNDFADENTKNPLLSIDIYTCRMPEWQDECSLQLQLALSFIQTSSYQPLKSIHVLKSIDKLSCMVIGSWTNVMNIEELFQSVPQYKFHMEKVNTLAIHGTMTDVLEKTTMCRYYSVFAATVM